EHPNDAQRAALGRLAEALLHDDQGIEHREGQGQNRTADDQRGGRFGRAGDGAGGEDQADEETSGIAHEDLGRRLVPPVEADQAAAEGGHDDQGEDVEADDGDDAERHRYSNRYYSGERVDAVDEIHGVDDADDPEDRHQPADVAQRQHLVADGDRGEAEAE